MRASLILFALSLFIVANGVCAKQAKPDYDAAGGPQATQAMHHDEAGTATYRGQVGGSSGEKFSLKIGPVHEGKSWVAVYVGRPGCLGDMDGQAAVRGNVLELTKDADGNDCALTIHRNATGATITENNCLSGHGASCDFDTRGQSLSLVNSLNGSTSASMAADHAAPEALGPAEVVSAVVTPDGEGRGGPFFDKGSAEFLRRYFTTQFVASWDHAMAQPEDVLDGDPITGSQALKSLKLQGTQINTQTPDAATVVAKLTVTPLGGKPYPQSVTFSVKRDRTTWKIDDISGPVDGSLRGYFKKSYGQ